MNATSEMVIVIFFNKSNSYIHIYFFLVEEIKHLREFSSKFPRQENMPSISIDNHWKKTKSFPFGVNKIMPMSGGRQITYSTQQ